MGPDYRATATPQAHILVQPTHILEQGPTNSRPDPHCGYCVYHSRAPLLACRGVLPPELLVTRVGCHACQGHWSGEHSLVNSGVRFPAGDVNNNRGSCAVTNHPMPSAMPRSATIRTSLLRIVFPPSLEIAWDRLCCLERNPGKGRMTRPSTDTSPTRCRYFADCSSFLWLDTVRRRRVQCFASSSP
jgi:hypothetical protein